MSDKLTIIVLTALFLILNIMDAHSTWLVLQPNHYQGEKNPIARLLFHWLGVKKGIITLKTVLLSAILYIIYQYHKEDPHGVSLAMLAANGIFVFVVRHNYRLAAKLGRCKWYKVS